MSNPIFLALVALLTVRVRPYCFYEERNRDRGSLYSSTVVVHLQLLVFAVLPLLIATHWLLAFVSVSARKAGIATPTRNVILELSAS